MRTYSAGLAGRLDVAFASVAQLGAVVAEQGQHAARFQPIVHNMRGWLLGTVGQWSAAAEAGEEALALAAEVGFGEPNAHAVLDLTENRLRAGDHAGAADRLGQAAAIAADDWVSMAWHQRQRLAWLRGRLALATGDRATAATEAAWLTSDAVDRGTRRYELLARVLSVRPKASLSPTLWSRCWVNSNGLPTRGVVGHCSTRCRRRSGPLVGGCRTAAGYPRVVSWEGSRARRRRRGSCPPGRTGPSARSSLRGPALEKAVDLDDEETADRLAALLDRIEERLRREP